MNAIPNENTVCIKDPQPWKDNPAFNFYLDAKRQIFMSFDGSDEVEEIYQVFGKTDSNSYHNFLIGFYNNVRASVSDSRGRINLRCTLNRQDYFTHISNTCSHNFKTYARRTKGCNWLPPFIDPAAPQQFIDLLLDTGSCSVVSRKFIGINHNKPRGFWQKLIDSSEAGICAELRRRYQSKNST